MKLSEKHTTGMLLVSFDVDSLCVFESLTSGIKRLILTRVWVAAEIHSFECSGAAKAFWSV